MELKGKSQPHRKRIAARSFFLLLITLFVISLMQACSYSFTGASISPTVKTISVNYLPNNSQLVQPALSRKLTEAIRDKFTNQSGLALVSANGDLTIEGEITGYVITPVAITGDQKAALQRLTISINIRFTNKQDPTQNFEANFSRYEDYDTKIRLADVEESLIDLINENLVQDIFNKAVVNW